jgi:hypothetical protein
MARQRRGGGFRPPELRGTLGTLLRTTLAQAGTLRDALERGAREGRSRLDSAFSGRRRQDALAELGDIVLDLIRRGEIDLDELPEARDIVAHLDEIDAGVDEDHADDHAERLAPPPSRNRFDARRRDDDDGTVSSANWSTPTKVGRPGARPPAKPVRPGEPRVWRPPVDSELTPPRPSDEITSRERPDSRRSAAPKDPKRKGGIHFDEDEDLSEYMHPDDVPPKGTPDGDS